MKKLNNWHIPKIGACVSANATLVTIMYFIVIRFGTFYYLIYSTCLSKITFQMNVVVFSKYYLGVYYAA